MDYPSDKNQLIKGEGRTARVVSWSKGTVLKRFFESVTNQTLATEAAKATMMHSLGIATPEVIELVDSGDTRGIVYQAIEGKTMEEELTHSPSLMLRYGYLLGRLHCSLHSKQLPTGLPHQKSILQERILKTSNLGHQTIQQLIAVLEELPEERRICHGDFHPGNIIMAANGPVIIDWLDATAGNPMADVARTKLLLSGAIHGEYHRSAGEKLGIRVLLRAYRRGYKHYDARQVQKWLPIMAAARLGERVTEEEEFLIALIRKSGYTN